MIGHLAMRPPGKHIAGRRFTASGGIWVHRPAADPSGASFRDRSSRGSTSPGGPANDTAEVASMEKRLLVRDDVGLDVPERRVGLVLDAVVEGLNDVLFEMLRAGMSLHDRRALDIAVFGITQS